MKNKHILLVEDNPDDADLTMRALRKQQILNRVEIARDGAAALDVLAQSEDLPALVLLDVNLPKVNGLEVLRQIRSQQRTRSLPVVILTSSAEEQDMVEAYHHHVNSYIRKPVDFVQFTEAVRLLGLYWLLLNEPSPRLSETSDIIGSEGSPPDG